MRVLAKNVNCPNINYIKHKAGSAFKLEQSADPSWKKKPRQSRHLIYTLADASTSAVEPIRAEPAPPPILRGLHVPCSNGGVAAGACAPADSDADSL